MKRSKVSQIANPIPVKPLGVRETLANEVARRGVEQDARAKRNRSYARHEPRPEVRAALNVLADRHENSALRADKSRWIVQ